MKSLGHYSINEYVSIWKDFKPYIDLIDSSFKRIINSVWRGNQGWANMEAWILVKRLLKGREEK